MKVFDDLQDKIPRVSGKATTMLNNIEKCNFAVAFGEIEKFAK